MGWSSTRRTPRARPVPHDRVEVVFVGGPLDGEPRWLWPGQLIVAAGDGTVYHVEDLTHSPRRDELIGQGYTEAWRYAFHAG